MPAIETTRARWAGEEDTVTSTVSRDAGGGCPQRRACVQLEREAIWRFKVCVCVTLPTCSVQGCGWVASTAVGVSRRIATQRGRTLREVMDAMSGRTRPVDILARSCSGGPLLLNG
jgi:hypothetical protein